MIILNLHFGVVVIIIMMMRMKITIFIVVVLLRVTVLIFWMTICLEIILCGVLWIILFNFIVVVVLDYSIGFPLIMV